MPTIETLEKGVKMLKLNNKNTKTTSSPSRQNAGSKLILKDLIKEVNMINANDTVRRDISSSEPWQTSKMELFPK